MLSSKARFDSLCHFPRDANVLHRQLHLWTMISKSSLQYHWSPSLFVLVFSAIAPRHVASCDKYQSFLEEDLRGIELASFFS